MPRQTNLRIAFWALSIMVLSGRSALAQNCGPADSLLYVNKTAPGPIHDGRSWSTAFLELRDALNSPALVCATQIWIAGGIYTPSDPIPPNADTATVHTYRHRSFHLRNNLAIYGGFAGTEQSLSDRTADTIAAHPTFLSGDLNGNDAENRTDDNVLHVVTGSDTDQTALLDSVTITGGNASTVPETEGGGIYVVGSGSPYFRNCTISGNVASAGGGGAVTIRANVGPCSPTFDGCHFVGNHITSPNLVSGAAFYQFGPGTTAFVNCEFRNNSTIAFGGAIGLNQASATFLRCNFVENRSDSLGGAIDARAISVATFVQCRFLGNHAGLPGDFTTGGGAIHTTDHATLNFADCLFVGNSGSTSGAIGSSVGSSVTLVNCDVVANSTESTLFGALAHVSSEGVFQIYNCLITGNTNGNGGGIAGAQIGGGSPSGSYEIQYSSIEGGTGSLDYFGYDNDSFNPQFARNPSLDIDDYGDLHVMVSSPAIDSGNTFYLPQDVLDANGDGDVAQILSVDLDGQPRLQGPFIVVDRGCYEYTYLPPPPPPSDFYFVNGQVVGQSEGAGRICAPGLQNCDDLVFSFNPAFIDLSDASAIRGGSGSTGGGLYHAGVRVGGTDLQISLAAGSTSVGASIQIRSVGSAALNGDPEHPDFFFGDSTTVGSQASINGTFAYQGPVRPFAATSNVNGVITNNPWFEPVPGTGASLIGGLITPGQYTFSPFAGFYRATADSHYAATNVIYMLTVASCLSDFNSDGVLNADDLADFITGYFNTPPDSPCDFNNDGVINADDLADFITAYFNGCG